MSNKKTKMISMRMTDEQFKYLDAMAKRIKDVSGFHITRASIMLKLMEYGYPLLEREFPKPETEPQTGFTGFEELDKTA